MAAHTFVSAQTMHHTVTVENGILAITGEGQLSQEETLLLLEVLLIWHYGFEEVPSDHLEK